MAYNRAQEEVLKKNFPLKIKHLPSGEELTFKAMVTQFEDQYSSEWNTEQVFGRMDPIRTFRGTQRIITLGWDVVAADLEEARDNMKNCGTLMAMLYPSYEGATENASNIKSAPLFQVKFANLISSAATAAQSDSISDGVVGSIDGLVYAPDIEQDFFAEGAGVLYPQTIRLSFALTVAHTHALGWKAEEKKKQRQDNFPYFVKKTGPTEA